MRPLIMFSSILCVVGVSSLFVTPTANTNAAFLTSEERAHLEAEYDKIQAEIAEWQKVLDETRNKKDSLQGDVNELNALIKKATAQIRQRNVEITRLTDEINQKEQNLSELESKLQRGRASLANILRVQNTADDRSVAELILSADDFSEFFGKLDSLSVLKRDLQLMFVEIRDLQATVQEEREMLTEKQRRELDARYDVERSRQQVAANEAQKQSLLDVVKSEEKTYADVLAERQRQADQIRSALFDLRDAEGIPFAQALEYATEAERATGVRAAFILAILEQESNLGKNVGQCLLVNTETGAGKGKNTGRAFSNVMHPTRDVPIFVEITSRLGRDPFNTPVSCPQSIGYGGAMGPSQFIASTWNIYSDKLAKTLNVGTADPWIPKHAIMATSLFVKDLGANEGGYSAEREAAGRYYAGGNWKTLGLGYAASVIALAEKHQDNIDFLKSI
ncbi:hypothetical protein COU15_03290 [Candidatus Kaiserbacteria bacterium CG10_big_fil_rev_8_21_14_0_10_45_20]|uniref:Transglycosylase SLT domain-containing protein n=1 Tax=Candidatus Kaiserbacteria bacterium CG10_big_fil_rev_8_21_14_0_10_45_20 TaxID=1974607 RepID=A0A2H0UF10_9BACT|nr:MAG: hypothetical protein COU15_03290 [Candidatus Kaiserbacteria bacterium CG10_big_fil_rev_8_21_14_0_10_45_20]